MSEALESRLAALEAQVGELRDREAIREVIHRYCQAVDRCDLEMLKSCYHADGYDDHGFFAGNAHEFAEYVIPCLERIDSSMHSITNTRFQFDGDRCATTSQWHVVHRLQHEAGFTDFWHQGRYLDVWEKRDGEWKLLHRVIAGDLDRWIETLDFRSSMLDSPNQALRGCRGADDPGNLWFDLLQHRPERPPMDDLWAGFRSLSEATRKG
ncbi:MAG: nuclear transport factor 2 family protein [Gammaproteobacteria bacterium]|nr:nuclear transport factor 2 family protein [Gammaproteobacteria bacterium]